MQLSAVLSVQPMRCLPTRHTVLHWLAGAAKGKIQGGRGVLHSHLSCAMANTCAWRDMHISRPSG